VTLGDLTSGMSVSYVECQWDWHWCFHQQIFVLDATQSYAQIIKHTDPRITEIHFSECIPPKYPLEEATVFTRFYINYDPITAPECQQTGVEPSSWGAIKGMFTQ
jgi:hypothetical protein